MTYVSVFCASLSYLSLLQLARTLWKHKALPSFLLPVNPFPPQLQDNKNQCTFSISCEIRYLYGTFTVFATATTIPNFISATVIRLCKKDRHSSSFALRLFATSCLWVTNKNYSRVHYWEDWKLLLYNMLSEKERKPKIRIQKIITKLFLLLLVW